jgi:hypothetical protein
MPIHQCPQCSLPYVDAEVEQGLCPCCNAPLGPPPATPRRDEPTPAPTETPSPRRAVPFLLGLIAGCLIGSAVLWAGLWYGGVLPGDEVEPVEPLQAAQARQAEADKQAKSLDAARQAAEATHARTVKSLDEANRQAEAALKQKEDAERRLRDALARLTEEQARRAALEKDPGEGNKPGPMRSFVRDWQLLGPFPANGEQAHDAVYPPEREPVQIQKAYNGFGGMVKWRPYHSVEDKIDLAEFFNYRQGGVAYAVTWVHSDEFRGVTLGVGSDDGVRLWVNRKQVHDVKGGRQAKPGQDLVKARLKRGWNEILAKVDNIAGTWELYLELRTTDGGEPLKLLSTSAQPRAGAR